MTDEKQDEMSMDEILSSIKDILTENGDTSQSDVPSSPKSSTEDISDFSVSDSHVDNVTLSLDDGDILDLTSDMRAETPVVPQMEETPIEDIDINDELSSVTEIATDDAPIDIVIDTTEDIAQETTSELDNFTSFSELEEDNTDPIYIPEEDLSEPLYNVSEETIADMPEIVSSSDNFGGDVSANEVETSIANIIEEPNPTGINNEAEEQDNAVDVSANIINNFAKIFAEQQEDITPEPTKVGSSVKLGADATISDIVKATIRDIIAEDMVRSLAQNADIKSLAAQEVSSQVKIWLDNNLPTMVETVVKQQIERVMAKAGKH